MDVEKIRRLFFRFGNSELKTAFGKILSDAEITQRTLFRIPDDPHSLCLRAWRTWIFWVHFVPRI